MGRGRLRLLFPASLPLWALATGAALAASPAVAPGAAAKVEASATAGKPAADAAKGDAKEATKETGAKGEAKTDTKKPGEVAKTDGKSQGEAVKDAVKKEGEVAKKEGVAAAPAAATSGDKGGKKDEVPASAPGAAGAGAAKKTDATPGAEEPAPLSGPPLKLSSLRDEMSRPARKEERPPSRAERERLEHLAAEINKAREALRQDTARLEAMLAARDAAPPAAAAAPASDSSEPTKKVPSPLDNLAKAIRGMKPEQAAPIISRVERKLAADVLLRMPGGDAGKVLGVCKPEVAAELAAEIASRAPRAELKR